MYVILLELMVCGMAEYFLKSEYKQQVKILAKPNTKMSCKLYTIQLYGVEYNKMQSVIQVQSK